VSDAPTLTIVIAPRARVQLITVDEWWREHRPEAPELIQLEFGEALEQLRTAPRSGVFVLGAPVPDLRRVLLVRTRYHVYYVFDEQRATVEIMAVWHAMRGRGPVLR